MINLSDDGIMFTVDDDGVASFIDEENLISVDKNELEQFIESYQELEKENEQLKKDIQDKEEIIELYQGFWVIVGCGVKDDNWLSVYQES